MRTAHVAGAAEPAASAADVTRAAELHAAAVPAAAHGRRLDSAVIR